MLLFILAGIGGARSFSCNKSARADEGPEARATVMTRPRDAESPVAAGSQSRLIETPGRGLASRNGVLAP
jgi:hypothetical protein